MSDVHIIGAGPAGSCTALSALRSGYSVTISEEHPTAGVPTHCSGLFSKDGLESLSDFFSYKKLIKNPINGAIITLGSEKLTIKKKEPIAYACDRAGLDRTLARNAELEGAKINFNQRINGIDDLVSDNIIGADGPVSFVAGKFGFPKLKRFASTLQAHLPYRSEDKTLVEVFVNNELFPGFFGWIIPHNEEYAEFGCGVIWPKDIRRAFDNLLKIKGISKISSKELSGCIIPLSVRAKTSTRIGGKNVLLVGDAAGQTKATTGGGVIFGGNCGREAGKNATSPFRYELSWRTKYLPDLLLHNTIHHYLGSKKTKELNALAVYLKNLRMDQYLSANGHMDKPTKMVGLPLLNHLISLPLGGDGLKIRK